MVKVYTLKDIQLSIDNQNETIPYMSYVKDTIKNTIKTLNETLVEINPVFTNGHTNGVENKTRTKKYDDSQQSGGDYYQSKRKNNKFSQQNTPPSIETWIAVRKFKPTKMEVKEGIEKNLNEIRTVLNKITNKNYDTQKDLIFLLIDKNMSTLNDIDIENEDEKKMEREEEQKEMMNKIGNFIFDISSTNKFYSELYANLYKELIDKYSVFSEILHSYLTCYKDIKILPYVDSNKDYDGYCEYTKSNEKRRSTINFFILLMKHGILDSSYMMDLAKGYMTIIKEQIDQEGFTNEIDEYSELISIIITNGKTCMSGNIYEELREDIITIGSYKMKEKKSLSSRSLFKYKDIVKIL